MAQPATAAAISPSRSRRTVTVLIFSVLCDLAIFGVLVFFFMQEYTAREDLQQNGVTVQGTVIDRRIEYDNSDEYSSTTYYLRYQYIIGYQSFSREESVDQAIYDRYHLGDRLRVVYSSVNPANARLPETLNNSEFTLPVLIGGGAVFLLATVGMAILLFIVLQRSQKARRLESEGIYTQGLVLSSWNSAKEQGKAFKGVTYQFEIHDMLNGRHKVYRARQMMSENNARNLPEGETVPIKYLESDPNVSRIELPNNS